MVEENEKTQTKVEEPKKEALSIVEEAKRVRDEIRAENDRRENLLREEQKLKAEQMLAGTGGGNVPQEKPKELTPREYKDLIMSGKIPNG